MVACCILHNFALSIIPSVNRVLKQHGSWVQMNNISNVIPAYWVPPRVFMWPGQTWPQFNQWKQSEKHVLLDVTLLYPCATLANIFHSGFYSNTVIVLLTLTCKIHVDLTILTFSFGKLLCDYDIESVRDMREATGGLCLFCCYLFVFCL